MKGKQIPPYRFALFTLSDLKEMLGVSQGTIQNLKSAGELGVYRYGEYNDYPVEAVLAYVEKRIAETSEALKALKKARQVCKRRMKKVNRMNSE